MLGMVCLMVLNWILWSLTAGRERKSVLLISLDGFRSDYLGRGKTPNLQKLAESGAKVRLEPSFPSLTFPNHFTLVTGRYPAWHGIVGNNFWDSKLNDSFFYTTSSQTNSCWWQGEPVN